jgi:OOP family OmpA-OmpF porin
MRLTIACLVLLAVVLILGGCSTNRAHIGMWVTDAGGAPDNDADGVTDDIDQCLGTPANRSVDSVGCSNDDDNDGIPNRWDQCPDSPADQRVDARGCVIDADGDGVVDAADQCPNTPPETEVNGRGCEVTTKPPSELPRLTDVHFEFDSAKLKASVSEPLEQIIEAAEARPDARLRVIGYTDSMGSEGYNLGLAMRRARAVVDRLIEKGMSGQRLSAMARGEQEPLAPNDTEAGRALNRRVEFELIE